MSSERRWGTSCRRRAEARRQAIRPLAGGDLASAEDPAGSSGKPAASSVFRLTDFGTPELGRPP